MAVSFILGVISSIVATIIFVWASWFTSTRVRLLLIRTLGRLSKAGYSELHSRPADRSISLQRVLNEARWVKIFAVRGNELVSGALEDLWEKAPCMESVDIIILDPDAVGTDSWISHHEREVSRYDRGFRQLMLSDQVRANIAYLANRISGMQNVQLRVSNFPSVARIIMSDRCAMVTLYSETEHGREASYILAEPSSPLYPFARRLFNMAHEVSRLAGVNPTQSADA